MAPTRCTTCGQEVEPAAEACPHCGSAVQAPRDRARSVLLNAYSVGCLTILALLTVVLVYRLATVFL